MAGYLDLLGVHAADTVIVGLAVLGEDLLDFRIRLLAGFLDGLLDHTPTAVRHHGTLARNIGLQTDNHIVDFRRVDVAGAECVDASRCVGVDVVDALLALYCQIVVIEILPQVLGLLSGVSQEGLVTLIRRVVLLNKVTDINVLLPVALREAFPSLSLKLFRGDCRRINCCHFHSFWVLVWRRIVTSSLVTDSSCTNL